MRRIAGVKIVDRRKMGDLREELYNVHTAEEERVRDGRIASRWRLGGQHLRT